MNRLLKLLPLLLLTLPATVLAQLEFRTIETEHMRLVYYDPAHEYIFPHLSRCFENSMRFYRDLFDYEPNEKVTVILRDLNDHGYAGATSLPFNYLIIGIEPFEQVYETSPTNERLNWVMSHELLHVVASDQASSRDRFWRKMFFGKVQPSSQDPLSMYYSYLTSPRMYAPRWFHEGMAVFMETWMAGGYGRALGGYDEMVFRTMVAEDAFFYDYVGLESEGTTVDFQVGQNSYLYGTRFISYLADQYGPEKVVQWCNRNDGSKRSFSAQFKNVYGRSIDDEWKLWVDFEHEWQRVAIDTIQQYPLTQDKPVSSRALGSVSRAYYDAKTRKVYTAVLYPGEFAHIAEVDVDTWESRNVQDIKTPALYYVASLAYDDSAKTVFYTTDNSRYWRDLHRLDLETGKSRQLLKDIRTGDICYSASDRSLWGIRHHDGLTRLVVIPAPFDDVYEVLELPFGRDLFDIDVSPDGRYVTGTLIEVSGRQRLIRLEIDRVLLGDSGFEVLYEFPNYSPANFVYSPDGRYLFGTSYSTGVSNVTRYDFETRRMEWITNATTGYFRPLPVSQDSLIAFRYTAEGFLPVMLANDAIEDVAAVRFLGQEIVDKYPIVRDWMLDSPAKVEIDSTALVPSNYRGLTGIRFQSMYPIVEVYKERVTWGLRFNLADPMWLHGIEINASTSAYSTLPSDEQFHATAKYNHWPWELFGVYNHADFYDLFGPTKRSRKGYGFGGSYEGILLSDRPRHMGWKVNGAYLRGLDILPTAQNVPTTFSDLLTFGATIDYSLLRRTIGAVEPEKGLDWKFSALVNSAANDEWPRFWLDANLGFRTPWSHSSIWLRGSAGVSTDRDRDEPFANFFFGGFGNNIVDNRSVKRYHERYAFPGIRLNRAFGTNYGKMMVEWTLPALKFRRLGIPTLYVNWAHLSFFGSVLSTNLDVPVLREDWSNVGAQLDVRIVIFSTLSTTFSLGYANAWQGGISSNEFMISLKIL